MIKDWFHKVSLKCSVSEILEVVSPKLRDIVWKDTHYSQAPGTTWCFLRLPEEIHDKIELSVNCPVYGDYYIWNYLNIKDLLIHKDSNEPGNARSIVGCLPLIGEFETYIYSDTDLQNPIDVCRYGPGEVLILNNMKYNHGGRVLGETRLSLHFYLDIFNSENKSLEAVLLENRINKIECI